MPVSRKFIHQTLACIPALFLQFLLGIGLGWIAPTLKELRSDNPVLEISVQQAALLGSINEIGRLFGPSISSVLLDRIGRKNTTVIVSILNVVSWAVIIFSRDINVWLASRFLFGVGHGVNDVSASIYISEVCSPELRGLVGSGFMLTAMIGVIFGNAVTTYLTFRNAALVNTVFAICTVGVQYFSVETTYFLTMKGEHELARRNLDWLRDDHDNEDEWNRIRRNVEEEKEKKESFRTLLTDRTNLKAIFAVVGYFLLFSSIGFHTVLPYASLIFSPSKTFTTNEYTILYSVSLLVGGVTSLFLIEKFDRRPFIVGTFSIVLCCHVTNTALIYLRSNNYDVAGSESYPWILFACIALYGFVGVMICSTAYVLMGELLPLSVRAIGGSMAVTASSMAAFSTQIIFWPIASNFGMEANFVLYAVTSLLAMIFVFTVVPETRGKSLYEMHTKLPQTEY